MTVEVWAHSSLLSRRVWSMMAVSAVCAKSPHKCGRALMGRRLALPGPVGCCAFAHDSEHLERPKEVWAVWRALLLLFEERTSGPQENGELWALYPQWRRSKHVPCGDCP